MGNICTNPNNEDPNKLSFNLSTPIIDRGNSTNLSSLNETSNKTLLKANLYNTKYNINAININNVVTLINSVIKGFLLRKKYREYLKLDLMDFTNEIYFQYLSKTKNKKVSQIINNDKNKEILGYLRTNWSEFYKEDPNKDINIKINKCKKYVNGLIFNYKDKHFHSDNIELCLNSVIYCYKGSVDIYSNKKCGNGELVYLDGSQKLGTFYNDEFVGWNIYVNSDGALYVGYFINDKLNGKGLKYISEKEHIYKGDFVNNMRHGYGKDCRKSSKYEGQFSFDKKNGKGEIILNTGDVYKGEFKNNKITGFGHYIWNNNNHEYIGNFLNGKFHGEGFYKWGKSQYFKGRYINGVKEGRGEIGFNDGKKCFINFINGKPYGKGTLIDIDGSVIEAEFESEKLKNNNENTDE